MSFGSSLPITITVFFYLQSLYSPVLAQYANLPTFGDTIQVFGAMERTNQSLSDGFTLDILSPKDRTLKVQQNTSPLAAQFVTGTKGAGELFVTVSNYSYIIDMSELANDLIAKIALPYNPAILTQMGIQQANTYVATLAPDKKSWIVNEETRNVQRSLSKTRMLKMTSLNGEYLLVGRQTADMGNVFIQFGDSADCTVSMTGGAGIQEAEFIDGLRVSLQTDAALNMNVKINQGVNPGTLNAHTQSLNSFMWIVRTNNPFEIVDAKMFFPFNRNMLVALKPEGSSPSTMLTVGRRALNATSGTFLPFNEGRQEVRELPEDRILVSGVTRLDGQYIIMVTDPKNL